MNYLALVLIMPASMLPLTACNAAQAAKADSTLKTALLTIHDTVDPFSEVSARACVAKQDMETDAVRQGQQTVEQAEKKIEAIRIRCGRLRDAFDQIRTVYNEAVELVEANQLERAQVRLQELRSIWERLKEEGLFP